MTIGQLMRELEGELAEAPCRFTLSRYGPVGHYRVQIDSDTRGTVDATAWSCEGATESLIKKVLRVSGIACSSCGNRHLPAAMLETDEPEPKPLCDDCAEAAGDMATREDSP